MSNTRNNKRKSEDQSIEASKRMAITNANNPNDPLVMIMEQMKKNEQKQDLALTKLDSIGSDLNKVTKRVDNIEAKIDRLEKEFDDRVIGHINAAGKEWAPSEDDRFRSLYEEARKTVMIAPITASDPKEAEKQAVNIMHNVLKIQLDRIDAMDIRSTRPVFKRRKGSDGKWAEIKMVRIVFGNREDRDCVMSSVVNLAGNKSVRVEMEVPDFLLERYRRLEKLAFDLRKSMGVKTSVRFSNTEIDMVLMTKSGDQRWEIYNDLTDQD